MLKVY